MNKNLIFLFIIGISLLFGCTKNPTDINFTVEDTEDFTIPPVTGLNIIPILTPAFATNSWEGTYSTNKTDKNHLQSLKLKTLTLTITSPSGKSFGFLKSVDIYIEAQNQPDTKIAIIDNIPSNIGSTLTLNTLDAELAPYAKADNFTLKVNYTVQSNNPDNVNVHSDAVFNVVASVIQ